MTGVVVAVTAFLVVSIVAVTKGRPSKPAARTVKKQHTE